MTCPTATAGSPQTLLASPAAGPSRADETSGVWRLVLEHGPQAPSSARRAARGVMHAWGVHEETADDVLMVVSEFVTNAVHYAEPPIAVSLCHCEEAVLVSVTDGGPRPAGDQYGADRPADEHGRGTHIVDALATDAGDAAHDGLVSHWAIVSP
ncbi:ATP-binding protein [Streptomyces sp. NPDC001935]|uniref:ATP-binding protein n=1 Tax=Streptomyces sp. NPDC056738 TaxID=3345933 RepID=UPI00369B6643